MKWPLGVLIAVAAVVGIARADTIFSNLGPKGSFAAGDYYLAGPNADSGPQSFAVSFTPEGNFALGDVEIPLSIDSGANLISLAIIADKGGLPTGATLAQGTLSGIVPAQNASLIRWTPTAAVSLNAGESYWIVGAGLEDFAGGWNENNLGQTGFALNETGATWVNSGFTTPALRVNGTPAPTVIESDLGPGDPFDTVNGWPVIGENSGLTPQSLAVPITPDADFTLTKIEAALNGEGSNNNGVTLSIVADNSGLPTGETLLQETLTGVLSDAPAIVTWNPAQRITLSEGGIYWLVAQGVNDSFLTWQQNVVGAAGFAHAFDNHWATDLGVTPAYRVTGILGVAAPEPSALAYLFCAVAATLPGYGLRSRAARTQSSGGGRI